MAIAPKIEASNLSIADLFREFYSVPEFQREYIWRKSNVEKLLQDIVCELYVEYTPLEDTEYFLGSIVVFGDNDRTYQLIDGQQRLTTIYLFFCIIRDYLIDFGQESRVLEGLIFGVTQNIKTGDDINKYRLSLHYDSDGSAVLETIAAKKTLWLERYASNSAANLIEAFEY